MVFGYNFINHVAHINFKSMSLNNIWKHLKIMPKDEYIYAVFYLIELLPDEALGETAIMVLLVFFTCSGLNYTRIALTLVVIEHCSGNVRLAPPDICSRTAYVLIRCFPFFSLMHFRTKIFFCFNIYMITLLPNILLHYCPNIHHYCPNTRYIFPRTFCFVCKVRTKSVLYVSTRKSSHTFDTYFANKPECSDKRSTLCSTI